jgi:hypothetical protein
LYIVSSTSPTRKEDLDPLDAFIRKASASLPKHDEVSEALVALERIERMRTGPKKVRNRRAGPGSAKA